MSGSRSFRSGWTPIGLRFGDDGRELDEAAHPGGGGVIDRGRLPRDATRVVGARQEQRLNVVEGRAQRSPIREIARRELDRSAKAAAGRLRIADQDADVLSLLKQRSDDLRACVAGGSGHQDHRLPFLPRKLCFTLLHYDPQLCQPS
jgi:hypothetical protein